MSSLRWAQQPCHASLSTHVIPALGSAAMSCQPFYPCHPYVGMWGGGDLWAESQ
ncbi:MAG: hypothetical protein IKG95_04575 [Bacteroidales bacterium]|nr:hypothetical protein [Bacteroidales bacterium]